MPSKSIRNTTINNFRPNRKAFGFRSPHWVITNYFSKVQAKMIAHPFFQRLSKSRPAQTLPKEKIAK